MWPTAMAAAAATILAVGRAAALPLPFSDPQNVNGWELYAPLTDEFDELDLDFGKWSVDYRAWAGRPPGLFDASNVQLINGSLTLWARAATRNETWPPGYNNFTTSALHSVARTSNGYFELRSRSGSSAISSSWWFHFNDGEGTWTEIDIFESMGSDAPQAAGRNSSMFCSHTHIFSLAGVEFEDLPAKCGCIISNGGAASNRRLEDTPSCSLGGCRDGPFALDAGFHVFGLEWNASSVGIYVDAIPVVSFPAKCLSQPIQMDIDRETMPDWMGLPAADQLPDQPFEVDYVRAWKKQGGPPGAVGARRTQLVR